jgi:hypothetical protein
MITPSKQFCLLLEVFLLPQFQSAESLIIHAEGSFELLFGQVLLFFSWWDALRNARLKDLNVNFVGFSIKVF